MNKHQHSMEREVGLLGSNLGSKHVKESFIRCWVKCSSHPGKRQYTEAEDRAPSRWLVERGISEHSGPGCHWWFWGSSAGQWGSPGATASWFSSSLRTESWENLNHRKPFYTSFVPTVFVNSYVNQITAKKWTPFVAAYVWDILVFWSTGMSSPDRSQ